MLPNKIGKIVFVIVFMVDSFKVFVIIDRVKIIPNIK